MELEQYLQVIPYAILASIIICINLCSLTIILWSRSLMSRPQVILLINLIATHLIQGLVVMPVYAVRKSKQYPVGSYPAVCDTWRFTYMLTFYGTCINVLLIALDRVVATKYYLKYAANHYRHKHFACAVVVGWTYVVALCIIPFFMDDNDNKDHGKTPYHCHYNQPYEWTSFMLIFNTVIPYLCVIASYLYIRRQIREVSSKVFFTMKSDKCKSLAANNDSFSCSTEDRLDSSSPAVVIHKHAANSIKPRKSVHYRKVTRLIFRIVFIYGLTWTPSIIYYSIVTMTPDIFPASYYVSQLEMVFTYVIKYITFFNAAAAPIIYCYNHTEFRKEANKLFTLMTRRRNQNSNSRNYTLEG